MHRIVIAHDAARRCQELLGGTGSLVICPEITGSAHVDGPLEFPGYDGIYDAWARALKQSAGYAKTLLPFCIGDIEPNKGFIHVFDDTGLAVAMAELDTISDFVNYLQQREQYIRNGPLLVAGGEDDLLAHYLQSADEKGNHAFYAPADPEAKVIILEGEWELLQQDAASLDGVGDRRCHVSWG